MRLWHQDLIPFLPREQLLGQHRELCALRGKGFGKKHRTVDYVFLHPYSHLYHFHMLVIKEMEKRGYHVNRNWKNPKYRGKSLGINNSQFTHIFPEKEKTIYQEHNQKYLVECLENLKRKNVSLKKEK